MTFARVRSVCTTEYAESRSERWANGSSRDSASYRDGAPRIEETRNQCRSLPWPWMVSFLPENFLRKPRGKVKQLTSLSSSFLLLLSHPSELLETRKSLVSFHCDLSSFGMKNSISLKASLRQNISHFVEQGSGCLAGVIPGKIGKNKMPATVHSPWHEFCYFSLFQFLAAAELFTKNLSK